jgi:hypothetical protein
MRDPQDILLLYRDRKAKYALLHSKMTQIADIYNGRAEVPLPDMERDERPAVPNLLAQGVDQMAGRITSVTPSVTFSSMRPGVRKYDRLAQDAGRTIGGWWQEDRVMLKQKTRGRRIIAYGMAPVVIRWDYEEHRPKWHVRHPLESFPSLDLEPGQVKPQDCIFAFQRSIGWLQAAGYGDKVAALVGEAEVNRDSIVTLVEYIDKDHTVLLAVGYYQNSTYYLNEYDSGTLKGVVLENYPNLGDESPVVIPTRLTLDTMTGQFDNMIGMYYQQAKLMALETIAVEKGIFPDTYLVSRSGEQGRFLDGPHDGRTGRVNIIAGGDIKELQSSPGYLTNPTLDRLERAQRVTAGIPAEFGGESGTNIRTGRRGDAVLSAVIDFPVAEAQEVFAFALEEENEIAMGLAKAIDKDTKRTLYVGTGNNARLVTYVPTETFENTEHVVSYPATGSDINSLMIGIGQRVGMGTMSKETAQVLDPFIDNPEGEHDKIIAEGLEQALMSGIQQQASQGAIPPLTLSRIMTLVKNDKLELAEALVAVTEEAQKAEQAQAQAPGPPTTPDAAAAPATMAAMAGAPSPIPGASAGQQDLAGLMATLRQPTMTIQPMRGVARGAV